MKIVMELGPPVRPGFDGTGGPEGVSYQKFHGPFNPEEADKYIVGRREDYPIEVRLKPQFSILDLLS